MPVSRASGKAKGVEESDLAAYLVSQQGDQMQPRLVQVDAWPRFTGQLSGEQWWGCSGVR